MEENSTNMTDSLKRVWKGLRIVIIVAAIATIISVFVFSTVKITGESMTPTIKSGDVALLLNTQELNRGDVCTFSWQNKNLVKRVIGVAGDKININSQGTVTVNDEVVQEDYVVEKSQGESDIQYPYQVPENSYFVMGDQRSNSADSRSSKVGAVSKDQVVGKVLLTIWPFEDFGLVR